MAKKTTLNEIGEMLEHVVKHMLTKEDGEKFATKEDVAKLDVKIDKLDVSIHRELEAIKKQLENVSGYGKEIDHALERIAAIEKHLGIGKKIAA
jgi:hypothetical protein